MKKLAVITLILGITAFIPNSVMADNIIPSANNSQTTQTASSTAFAKSYKTSSENLLYLLLAALNAQNYSIEEIQFKTGSVLFKAYTKEFIASVAQKDGLNSFIKIIPADNIYNFSPVLLQKLHNYIELNNTISFQKIL